VSPIDINTGKYVGKVLRPGRQDRQKPNVDAIKEIVSQIRSAMWRHHIIDFIGMDDAERQRVMRLGAEEENSVTTARRKRLGSTISASCHYPQKA